ncbi:hypothetical protein HBH56_174910 [Parastagonospora nodorum]|uniref:DNA endonuclease activator Ctp1 C-terminal domain-containing protein n=1 Tax=Phaeosphaeria nodorum (strain SN15 / ATCC MYA-4574 / FGSC 10173) TaxID=321614 RepID=A0A7U2HY85_PHANO|nr:hypothetical protein HBH56_174910 [Parastagonospora nodorum]QRC96315.1 hypothetical protein JI435_012480 [Parastagonospora nodorum SN15]KAH3926333.1 hypothetical protein HBH54_168240 [Parastagonospora nodorum]KAH4007926.1 hypothetical protein HBI10_008930 [Parastagonospora nodorum]KAH4023606.1 hypothetical protein HBI13_090640 [Parastagonospora nodorum]
MSDFSAWLEKNKALWTRVYDEVIGPDLEEEWKKRDEAHEKELKDKDVKRQALSNHLEDQVVENSRLRSENEELKKKLEDLSSNALSKINSDQAATGASTASDMDLADKFNDLTKKYQDLSQKIRYLERKNSTVMQKNKDMKESVRAWQEYADRQSGRQRPKGETKPEDSRPMLSGIPQIEDPCPQMPSSPRSVVTVRTPLSLADLGRSSPAPIALPDGLVVDTEVGTVSPALQDDHDKDRPGSCGGSVTPKPMKYYRSPLQEHEESTELPELRPAKEIPGGYVRRHLQSYLQAPNPSSSQTTEDESAEQISRQTQFTAGDEDDMPEFVSARPLKRKRGQPSKVGITGPHSSNGTPVKPFRVKDEPPSSPPRAQSLVRKETIDLDDPTSTMLRTPRHPRKVHTHHPATTSAARHQRSSSAPFSQPIKREDEHLEHASISESDQSRPENLQTTNFEPRAYSEPSDPTEGVIDVLRQLDPNIIATSHDTRSSKRTKRTESHEGNVHQILSESGEEPPPADENTSRLAPLLARAKLNRKLHDSTNLDGMGSAQLSTHMPVKIKVEQNPTPPRSSAGATPASLPKKRVGNPQSEARYITQDSPATDGRPQWRLKAHESRSSVRKPQATSPVKQGRLRQKPVSELTLQDFKPNPAYNQGYTYAFSETVRKRGDRACLPGCTNPDCCGSTFRTFAEVQAPLPASQEDALLEDYLGEAYDNMNLTQMSAEERQELVLQARTKKMAKEAGKHREAYERRRTPPGFWRMDFPTTQEQQEDRDKSKEQEKRVVHERWLEAQRKGGKWLYRDE